MTPDEIGRYKRTNAIIAGIPFIVVLAILLALSTGCAGSLPHCHCVSDTECSDLCGGNGDPTPKQEL
jgi:hypothetical protein